ncbi:PH domain leucine-rich repeat-containing protein phosphatase 2 [Xylographa carneopallida]|nr:PH domain leucine-rich repeat-containing protein phosphatase 2 [Xylographa carneopallida]
MLSSTVTLLAFLGSAAAQNVVSLLIPDTDTQDFVGEVIGISPTATTYVIQCAPSINSSDCGFAGPFTLTEGPSTVAFTITEPSPADFTGTIACALTGSPVTQALCTQLVGGSDASGIGSTTLQLNSTDITLFPVTITGTANGVGAGSQSAASTTASGSAMATTTMAGTAAGAMTASTGMSSTPTGTMSGSSTASPTAKSGASQRAVGSVGGALLVVGMVVGML